MSFTATSCRTKTQRVFNTLRERSWTKTFAPLTNADCSGAWTDGTNIYRTEFWDRTGGLLSPPEHYIWNGDAWEELAWDWSVICDTEYTDRNVNYFWTDGTNIYFSNELVSAVLKGDKWEPKTWNSFPSIYDMAHPYGDMIWTDGTNIYYSYQEDNFILNGDKWEVKDWNGALGYIEGITLLHGSDIWTDGENIYYSRTDQQFVLDKTTDTWEPVTWEGYFNTTDYGNLEYVSGHYTWTDGTNTYLSTYGTHWRLNGYTWEPVTFNGYTDFSGDDIWTDRTHIYCSDFILLPTTAKLYSRANGEWVEVCPLC